MDPPSGEQGRPGFGVACARGKQFGASIQLGALPAGRDGTFHDDRPLARPGLDGIKVSGKPQAVQENAYGGAGPLQIGFAGVCHVPIARPVPAVID